MCVIYLPESYSGIVFQQADPNSEGYSAVNIGQVGVVSMYMSVQCQCTTFPQGVQILPSYSQLDNVVSSLLPCTSLI